MANSMMFRAASASTAICIALALANWYTKPQSALAWAAVLVMCAVMAGALRMWWSAARQSAANATAVTGLDSVPKSVVFAALMMGIPLALTLARAYGFVDQFEVATRSYGVLIGVFLMMLGNVMPKHLPPISMMGSDPARQQSFHRLAGWTWVLCGLALTIGWLVLPIDVAEAAVFVVVITALSVTMVQLRLVCRAGTKPANGLS